MNNQKWLFLLIISISLFFHLFNLFNPPKPVFDEFFFTTFAANYVRKLPAIDVHPPLGKLIYALFLTKDKEKLNNENAVFLVNVLENHKLKNLPLFKDYTDFPYKRLRLVSAFFGFFLTILVYLFIKILTKKDLAALLGAFFITFENSLLLETRLILLNGMYLVFGFLALVFLIKNKPQPFLSGLFWGLALSVKLIAVVFVFPILFFFFKDLKKRPNFNFKKALWIFSLTSFFVFTLILILPNALIPPVKFRLSEFSLFYNFYPKPVSEFYHLPLFIQKIIPYLQALFLELNLMILGYTYMPNASHPSQSYWFMWPIFKGQMFYQNYNLMLIGNVFVWFLILIAIIYSLLSKKYLFLTSFYFSSLLPFALVNRPTFLYHYFPALIFGIILAAIIFSEKIQQLSSTRKKIYLFLIIILTVFYFIMVSPLTFGYRTFF